MESKELTYKHGDTTFHIRSRATRRDQYDMHAAMADGTEIQDGKIIKTHAGVLYPWLIERFVTGWTGPAEKWSMEALYNQPAEPGEDLILGLGAFILNHSGLVLSQEKAELKNVQSEEKTP